MSTTKDLTQKREHFCVQQAFLQVTLFIIYIWGIRNGRPAKIRKKTFGEGEVVSWDVALKHCI